MSKIVGFIFILAGIALIAVKLMKITIPYISELNILLAIIIGAILIVAGFLFLKPTSEKKEEVPIYEKKGRKVVGYRRVK